MGLFGNIFKPLQGKLTAKQEENMKKVAEVFKEKTGKDYHTAVVWKMTKIGRASCRERVLWHV